MKRWILSLGLALFSAQLHGVIVTDYPDPFTRPGDPDYEPRRSYVVPDGPSQREERYYPQYDSVETREEAIQRQFEQRARSQLESNPTRSLQEESVDRRVRSQQEQLKERLLKQQQALDRY